MLKIHHIQKQNAIEEKKINKTQQRKLKKSVFSKVKLT